MVAQHIPHLLQICEPRKDASAAAEGPLKFALIAGRPCQAYEMDCGVPGRYSIMLCLTINGEANLPNGRLSTWQHCETHLGNDQQASVSCN